MSGPLHKLCFSRLPITIIASLLKQLLPSAASVPGIYGNDANANAPQLFLPVEIADLYVTTCVPRVSRMKARLVSFPKRAFPTPRTGLWLVTNFACRPTDYGQAI
ncbi:hypothetical protein F5Y15DRAFT_272254 [Xylariaceae sp. FL0016]|nr:hypothetical protein F5Y15DRAFT_272254 [Xylariaceae sp. FL0016]